MSWLWGVLALSLISIVCYGVDKSAAKSSHRRIPEKTLHILSLLGGWPGALIGQRLFRHKTSKLSFQIVYWLTVLLNCAIIYYLYRSF